MLSWIASTAAKQAALMALMASLPGMWWAYSGLTEADLEDPAKFATAHVLLSLGLALFVAGLAYKVRRSEGGVGGAVSATAADWRERERES